MTAFSSLSTLATCCWAALSAAFWWFAAVVLRYSPSALAKSLVRVADPLAVGWEMENANVLVGPAFFFDFAFFFPAMVRSFSSRAADSLTPAILAALPMTVWMSASKEICVMAPPDEVPFLLDEPGGTPRVVVAA